MVRTKTEEYVRQGYLSDDCKMIKSILENNWENDQLKDKVYFYFSEVGEGGREEASTFDFSNGEMAIRIYEHREENSPRGIGFDSMDVTKRITIDIRTIDRDLFINARDEIRRIIYKYRLRPGNSWATMWPSVDDIIYPTFKFYHADIDLTLRKYCNTLPRPREGWCSEEWY